MLTLFDNGWEVLEAGYDENTDDREVGRTVVLPVHVTLPSGSRVSGLMQVTPIVAYTAAVLGITPVQADVMVWPRPARDWESLGAAA
jgi:hypothetical protein